MKKKNNLFFCPFLFFLVLVLLSAHVERFSVSRMHVKIQKGRVKSTQGDDIPSFEAGVDILVVSVQEELQPHGAPGRDQFECEVCDEKCSVVVCLVTHTIPG